MKNYFNLMFCFFLIVLMGACAKEEQGDAADLTPDLVKLSYGEMIKQNTDFIKSIVSEVVQNNYEGMEEVHLKFLNKNDQPLSMILLNVNLNSTGLNIAVTTPNNGPEVNSLQRLSAMITAKNAGHTDKRVIAGVNGDFFDFTPASPLGPVHMDGLQIRTSMSTGYKFFGRVDNGNYVLGNYDFYQAYKSRMQEVVGGRYHLVENGNLVPQTLPEINPRTGVAAVDFKKVMIVVVDGRDDALSVGISLTDFGKLFKALGAKDAICLDGGGSTEMIIRNKTNGQYEVKNKLSDGAERAIANGLVVMQSTR